MKTTVPRADRRGALITKFDRRNVKRFERFSRETEATRAELRTKIAEYSHHRPANTYAGLFEGLIGMGSSGLMHTLIEAMGDAAGVRGWLSASEIDNALRKAMLKWLGWNTPETFTEEVAAYVVADGLARRLRDAARSASADQLALIDDVLRLIETEEMPPTWRLFG